MKIKEAFVQKFQIPSIQLKFQWRLANVTIYPRLHSEYLDTTRAGQRIVRKSLCFKLSTPRISFCLRNLWKRSEGIHSYLHCKNLFRSPICHDCVCGPEIQNRSSSQGEGPAWLQRHEGLKHHERVKFMSQRLLFSDHRSHQDSLLPFNQGGSAWIRPLKVCKDSLKYSTLSSTL